MSKKDPENPPEEYTSGPPEVDHVQDEEEDE